MFCVSVLIINIAHEYIKVAFSVLCVILGPSHDRRVIPLCNVKSNWVYSPSVGFDLAELWKGSFSSAECTDLCCNIMVHIRTVWYCWVPSPSSEWIYCSVNFVDLHNMDKTLVHNGDIPYRILNIKECLSLPLCQYDNITMIHEEI